MSKSSFCFAAALALGPQSVEGQARLQQVAENQLWPGFSLLGDSEIIAADAIDTTDRPVVLGGNFRTAISFPVPAGASWTGGFNPGGSAPGIFTGVLREPTPGSGWHAGATDADFDYLQPFSAFSPIFPSCEMRDLAVIDDTGFYPVGVVTGTTWFENKNGTVFSVAAAPQTVSGRGFVATIDNGVTTGVTLTDPAMRPRAADFETTTTRLVLFGQERDAGDADFEGADALLQRYVLPPSSTPAHEIRAADEPKLASLEARDVAVTTNDTIWIGGSLDGTSGTGALGGGTDLLVGSADFGTTSVVDDFRLGSEDSDEWGAMAAGPNGEVYVAFTIDGTTATFGTLTHNLSADLDPGLTGTRHAFLGLIRSDGTPAWVVPLGVAKFNNAGLIATGLDVDSAGTAYVSVEKTGQFEILGRNYFNLGGGQVAVDGTGRLLAYTPVTGVSMPRTSVVFDIEHRFVLGSTFDGPSTTNIDLAFSSIEPDPISQSSYTICWADTTNTDIEALADLVFTTTGGLNQGSQVTLVSSFPNLGLVCVSGILDPDQFITLDNNPDVEVDDDPFVIAPDSGGQLEFATAANAGWALARLHDPLTLDTGPGAEFPYPAGFVTGTSGSSKVRVYIVDKGIAPTQSFDFQDLGSGAVPISFDGAGGLCVNALAHPTTDGAPDPDTSSDHPKQAVNLIGATALGSAQGTAMEFVNVDMYSGAATQPDPAVCKTYLSFVSHAILQAVNDAVVRASPPINDPLPSLILIPSSGPVNAGASSLLDGAINQALAFNIPVIVSAGNADADVSGYVPARLGSLPGVITVGAVAEGTPAEPNIPYVGNNDDTTGSIITLYAPGVNVPTGEFGTATGTSYACALVAGLAANYLSFNPTATPAEVEQALIDFGYADPRGFTIARSGWFFAMWLYQNGLGALVDTSDGGKQTDSDGDGSNNLAEFLGCTDPSDPLDRPSIPSTVTLVPSAASLSLWLPQAVVRDDGRLGDSSGAFPFDIELSTNLQAWDAIDQSAGSFTAGPTIGALRELRFEFAPSPGHQLECYLRTNFAPPPAP